MKGISAYQENSVETLTQGQIVVKLYDGAIRFLRQAVVCIERKDYAGKNDLINKAVAIIDELNFNLNMEEGGEIASNLRALYGFMVRHLHQANVRCDAGMVRHVINLLETLNEGWRGISE